jgi:hypothetical protein
MQDLKRGYQRVGVFWNISAVRVGYLEVKVMRVRLVLQRRGHCLPNTMFPERVLEIVEGSNWVEFDMLACCWKL